MARAMQHRGFRVLLFFLAYSKCVLLSAAEQNLPEFSWHGLADFRYQYSSAQTGWADGGLGKFRFGGEASRVRVNEAAVVLQARWWEWSGTVIAKYAHDQKVPIDLTEAFLQYRPVSTAAWRFNAKLGMFFPPISLENTGTAWSSPYTLSSSAINSWVGEELRTFGGELHLNYNFDSHDRVDVFAAGFINNDAAGTLLAWKGWSLHDYEATLHDQVTLPQGIGIKSYFPFQANATIPFTEVDQRLGFYTGVTLDKQETGKFRLLYYDNMANPQAIKEGQYGWHTRFWSLGIKHELPYAITFIAQGMVGSTAMGKLKEGKRSVDVNFWSASALLSKSIDIHRFSIRYDHFITDQIDSLPLDNNNETGHAWTFNYNFTLAQQHQFNFEVNYIDSDRPARLSLNQAAQQEELLWQFAYRIFY